MLNTLRHLLGQSKPATYGLIAILVVGVLFFIFRGGSSGDPYSLSNMTRVVSVKFADTGEKVEMRWGEIETEIIRRPGMPSETEGLVNPKTGKLTGFPTDREAWIQMIERLRKTKAAYQTPDTK